MLTLAMHGGAWMLSGLEDSVTILAPCFDAEHSKSFGHSDFASRLSH